MTRSSRKDFISIILVAPYVITRRDDNVNVFYITEIMSTFKVIKSHLKKKYDKQDLIFNPLFIWHTR